MFECDIAHRRFIAVLFMQYKIGCKPMHPIYGALPAPYVLVRVKRGSLVHIGLLKVTNHISTFFFIIALIKKCFK